MDGWLVSSPNFFVFFSVDVDNNDNNNNANNCPPDLTKLPNYKKKRKIRPPHPHSRARIPPVQDALLLPANVAVAPENCGTRERERERESQQLWSSHHA